MFDLATLILDKNQQNLQTGIFRCEETIPILDLRTPPSNILNIRGKYLRQFVQEMDEKKQKKNNRCCKALNVNT